jgi:uncharacterized protein
MNIQLVQKVATELTLKPAQVASVIQLLFDEECTIPFVARYRKEMTGSLDEVALRNVRDRYHYLSELETSKAKYLKVVEEHCQKNPAFQGKFEELKRKFEACATRQELEDLYLPFKPKRRTRAMVAREKGLEPLLEKLLEERDRVTDLEALAAPFVTPAGADVAAELRVPDAAAALAGAADIFAERVNETAEWRALVRGISLETGLLTAKKVEDKEDKKAAEAGAAQAANEPELPGEKSKRKTDASKYENYFDYKEPLRSAPSHRIMAVRRGEAEKVLRVGIEVDEERILGDLRTKVLGERVATDTVKRWIIQTVDDAYKRLMGPSIETELRMQLKQTAEDEAITVFSKNLENLLLLPPIPGKTVMGVDPGIRTGSKLAVVDETGKLLDSATIYPDYRKEDHGKTKEAKAVIAALIAKHKVQCIAVGNGTGSREIDRFITAVLKEFNISGIKRIVVNEAGASVYSTDDLAREEFPDLDATIRSTVSIARRLQDPLAELVKINPRSIGVGQYQHDVNPNKLGRSLEEVVESCVNKVGVNLNTASYKLLGYVSGVGPTLAKNIVGHRNQHGKFTSRDEVLKVPGFGPKAYQQAAGFLRVPESANPLDNSSVHPERYEIVQMIATDLKAPLAELVGKKDVVQSIPWEKYVSQSVGMPTLKDIEAELIKPGRDPREDGARLMFSDEISEIEDLRPGMLLKGTVTNVTNFGAFVDIGVHQDGLVHISELSDTFVKDPSEVVAVGTIVDVRVLEVDVQRRRISLSCRSQNAPDRGRGPQQGQQRGQQQQQGARGPQQGQNRSGAYQGGGNRGGGSGGGGGGGGGYRGGSGGGNQRPKQPEKSHTLDDLLAKFGKK